jgi:hypothetical protein
VLAGPLVALIAYQFALLLTRDLAHQSKCNRRATEIAEENAEACLSSHSRRCLGELGGSAVARAAENPVKPVALEPAGELLESARRIRYNKLRAAGTSPPTWAERKRPGAIPLPDTDPHFE